MGADPRSFWDHAAANCAAPGTLQATAEQSARRKHPTSGACLFPDCQCNETGVLVMLQSSERANDRPSGRPALVQRL